MKETVEAPPVSGLSNKARTYALVVLTIVYAFNFIDRQIFVILQKPIKAEFDLSDLQLGVLSGISFALFYTILGLPIARLADRMNRRNIIAIALAVWSSMTVLCGMAQNYFQLVLARMGVGVGEAGGSPPAHSMISDMYTAKRRSTALAVYSAGLYLGVFLGYTLGGTLYEYFDKDWRPVFFVVGIPGILLSLILRASVAEPARPQATAEKPATPYSLRDTFKVLWKLNSFRYIALGCAMSGFVSYGTGNFMPLFMANYHGMQQGEIGIVLGTLAGIGGMIGTFLGGALTDRFGAKDARWYLWLPGLTAVLAIPIGLVALYTESKYMMFGTYFCVVILATLYLAPSIAVTHRLVPANMRAMSSAVLFLVLNLIGMGLGPVLVGAISDFELARTGENGLRTALTVGFLIAIVKGYLFWAGGRKLREDLAQN